MNSERPQDKQGKILIVDDFHLNVDILRNYLEKAGFDTEVSYSGEEAIRCCRDHNFDLIIMDIYMNGVTGYDAARQIRAEGLSYDQCPILALTGNVDREIEDKCRQAGMNDIFCKPVRREILKKIVEKWTLLPDGGVPPSGNGADIAEPTVCLTGKTLPMNLDTAISEFETRENVREAVDAFLHYLDKQISSMRDALDNGDVKKVGMGLHAVKGGARTIEAWPLSEVAEKLEDRSKKGDIEELITLLKNLDNEADRLKKFIIAHLHII